MTDLKTRRGLLTSAVRTATTVCPQQKDASQQYLRIYLHVTAAGASLTVLVRGYDLANAPAVLNAGGTGFVGPGMAVFEMMPSVTVANVGDVKEAVSRILPCVWDVQVVHADATPSTYTLTAEVCPPG